MQRTVAQRLITPPLLQPPERDATIYPCRLINPENPISTISPLLLHRSEDRMIEVIDDNRVIGVVEGDPAEDLNQYFDARPSKAEILRIELLSNDGSYLDFTVTDGGTASE
jgi:hypothetical protein